MTNWVWNNLSWQQQGGGDSLWSDGLNWQGGAVPTIASGDTVTLAPVIVHAVSGSGYSTSVLSIYTGGSLSNPGTIDVSAGATYPGGLTGAPVYSGFELSIGGATTLSGGGTLNLSSLVANGGTYYASLAGPNGGGSTASATLENVDNKIQGNGIIGGPAPGMVYGVLNLLNDAKGIIDQTGSIPLISYVSGLSNAGLIEATGSGGLTFDDYYTTLPATWPVIDQTSGGALLANGGNIDFADYVTVIGGTLQAEGGSSIQIASNGIVTFDGTGTGGLTIASGTPVDVQTSAGELIFAASAGQTGQIVNKGSISLGAYADLLIGSASGGSVKLSGGGSVTLGGSTNSRITDTNTGVSASANTLENADNTIQGGGWILASRNLTLTNDAAGVIDANNASSGLTITGVTLNNAGTLEAQNGATLALTNSLTNITADSAYAGGAALTGGTYEAGAGSTIAISGGAAAPITTLDAVVDLTGAGAALTSDGASLASSLREIGAGGTLYLGATAGTQPAFSDGNAVTVDSGGTLGLGGALFAASSLTVNGSLFGSALTGAGVTASDLLTASTVVNNGSVTAGLEAPGVAISPGALNISGNYSQSSTGVLHEAIAGTGAGQAGTLNVTGGATLAGTLNTEFANGFAPALGETFTVAHFTPGDLTGQFNTLTYNNGAATVTGNSSRVNIGNGLALQVEYNNAAGDIQLKTVTDIGPTGNFTGNATSDILGWNPSTGVIGDFVLNNGVAGQFQDIAYASPSSGYQVVGSGDFYSNSTADILLANGSGQIGQFEVNNNTATWQGIGLVDSGAGWAVVGTGDFYGNGTDDIVLANQSTGQIGEFEMKNGAATWQGIGSVGSGWAVAGTGDFYGNGTDDILLANQSTGQIGEFEMNNGVATWQGIGTVNAPAGWAVAGTGDFFGNGTDDILLANSQTGQLGMFAMHNGAATWQSIGAVGAGWAVAGAGDYFGNGTSDILLQNASTGGIGMFAMNNGVASWQGIASLPTGWKVS
jgi:hypothetical protein